LIVIGIDPLLYLGLWKVKWYIIILLLAVLIGLLWVWGQRKALLIKPNSLLPLIFVSLVGGIVGSRFFHIVDQFGYYKANPGAILGVEGQSIYGAILGGTLAAWVWGKYKRLPFWHTADIIAPGLLLAQATGRLGCVITGCCYGINTALPWAFVYTHPNSFAPLNMPTHPAVVYEMMWDMAVFLCLLQLRGKVALDGLVFVSYLTLYSLGRFFIDFFRFGDYFIDHLHQAQFIALVIMAIGIPLLGYRIRRGR